MVKDTVQENFNSKTIFNNIALGLHKVNMKFDNPHGKVMNPFPTKTL